MKNVSDKEASKTPAEVLQTAKEGAVQVKDTVAQEASRAVDSIKTAAKEQVERGKTELADSLKSVDQALRRTSSEMDNPTLAPQMERMADAVATAHQFIEEHRIEDLGKAVRRISLQHPVLFYSGIFALGFAAGRFFSSSQMRMPDTADYGMLENDPISMPAATPTPEVSHYGSH